jgi:hypothetical protein
MEHDNKIPTRVFIVPYRSRETQKDFFLDKMKVILEDIKEPYEIYFAHQCDNRPFNRGAMKNLGFIAIRDKYPNDYKNITFIFNDVDTFPCEKGLIDYTTTKGIVKHYYGTTFALGGIFSIKGEDFELTKGFPNFWGWGIEDNLMNDRCIKNELIIDRTLFYKMMDKRILRPFDGFNRVISKKDAIVYKYKTPDSLNDLSDIKMIIKNEFINITNFECIMKHNDQIYENFDIRKGNKIKIDLGNGQRKISMNAIMTKTNNKNTKIY